MSNRQGEMGMRANWVRGRRLGLGLGARKFLEDLQQRDDRKALGYRCSIIL